MTQDEKMAMVKNLANDSTVTDAVAMSYLTLAENKILQRAYPFKDISSLSVPAKYDALQCELAVRLLHRRGIEGEVSNTDNGVHRNFGSVNDDDILSEVVQVVGVL